MDPYDFTSALYLGLEHPARIFPRGVNLTTGKPLALYKPQRYRRLARKMAQLVGVASGHFGTSTLHVYWDLLHTLDPGRQTLWFAPNAYPVSHWVMSMAKGKGFKVSWAQKGSAFNSKLHQQARQGYRPVIFCDGWYVPKGEAFPLRYYQFLARKYGGQLVIDDTQSLGVLGKDPTKAQPWGFGGGGIMRWLDLSTENTWYIASTAKALGVPLCFLGGSEQQVQRWYACSVTTTHSSPPALILYNALERALAINRSIGETLRSQLLHKVLYFRQSLGQDRIRFAGLPFPVQYVPGVAAGPVHSRLKQNGLRTLLLKGEGSRKVWACAFHPGSDVKTLTDEWHEVFSNNVQQVTKRVKASTNRCGKYRIINQEYENEKIFDYNLSI